MFSMPKFIGVGLSCGMLSLTLASIISTVQTKEMSDRLSTMSRLDVATECGGVINLNGAVETAGRRVRAESLAQHVENVIRVNDTSHIQNRVLSETQPNPAQGHDTEATKPGRANTQAINLIQGDVLRVDYDKLVIQHDGHEVHLQYDENTQMTGYIGPGEHIEAKVDERRYVLSVRQLQ